MRVWLFLLGGAFALAVACGGATKTSIGAGDGGVASSSGSDASSDAADNPTLDAFETCSKPGTCVLDAPGCCGLGCQSDSELIAVQRGAAPNVIRATCNENPPAPCPGCERLIDVNINAFCRAGKCAVVDLRTDVVSACTTDDQCILFYATCCQPCNGGSIRDIVALARGQEGELTLNLCDGTQTCDKCLPSFPLAMRATCNQTTGHCEVH
jgi:hypothetical protein